jgi:hypothetical protein
MPFMFMFCMKVARDVHALSVWEGREQELSQIWDQLLRLEFTRMTRLRY